MFPTTHAELEAAVDRAEYKGGFGQLYDSLKGGFLSGGAYRLLNGDLLAFEELNHNDGRLVLLAAIYSAASRFKVGVPLNANAAVERVRAMSDDEVLVRRRWPAWFTVADARAQLEHEARGCPRPFPDAARDGVFHSQPRRAA